MRKTWPFEVDATEAGDICITQEFFGFDEPNEIIIHPEQIDLLVKWLYEVRDELQEACDDLQEE